MRRARRVREPVITPIVELKDEENFGSSVEVDGTKQQILPDAKVIREWLSELSLEDKLELQQGKKLGIIDFAEEKPSLKLLEIRDQHLPLVGEGLVKLKEQNARSEDTKSSSEDTESSRFAMIMVSLNKYARSSQIMVVLD